MLVISYASRSHQHFQDRLASECQRFGIKHKAYNATMLDPDFKAANEHILRQPRGAGFWIWKPPIILDAFQYSDLVCYLDASTRFLVDPRPLLESVDKFLSVQTVFQNSHYTKRDCFHYMGCDEEKYWNACQVWAGVTLVRRAMIPMVEEWGQYCQDARIVTDAPNTCGLSNYPGLVEHRHDQSILTNLVVKYQLPTVSTTQFIDG